MLSWYFVRIWAKRIEEKFDKIIESLQEMNMLNTQQSASIDNINKMIDRHDKKLNVHAERIRNLELEQVKITKNG